jgi:hypothetical protein
VTFKPLNTRDASTSFRKILVYGNAGTGKTTQAINYQRYFGPGFIISGEAGLSSIRGAGIDYLPFQSFDGKVDEANGVYSFRHICRLIQSPDFKAAGYKWLMVDSITELSDMVMSWATAKAEQAAKEQGRNLNNFDLYRDYGDAMMAACRYIRDLPYHVILTALAKESENESGTRDIWPAVNGNKLQSQIPGIFDCVFALVKGMSKAEQGKPPEIRRFIVTDEIRGYHCKARDEKRLLKPIEETADITTLIKRLEDAEANS